MLGGDSEAVVCAVAEHRKRAMSTTVFEPEPAGAAGGARAPEPGDAVELNIGGTRFTTTVETLTLHPGSILGRMFAPENAAMLGPGPYFFDRDPEAFRIILNYFRTGALVIPPSMSLGLLEAELDFFQIDLPADLVPICEAPQDRIVINVGGRRFGTYRSTFARAPASLLGRFFGPDGEALSSRRLSATAALNLPFAAAKQGVSRATSISRTGSPASAAVAAAAAAAPQEHPQQHDGFDLRDGEPARPHSNPISISQKFHPHAISSFSTSIFSSLLPFSSSSRSSSNASAVRSSLLRNQSQPPQQQQQGSNLPAPPQQQEQEQEQQQGQQGHLQPAARPLDESAAMASSAPANLSSVMANSFPTMAPLPHGGEGLGRIDEQDMSNNSSTSDLGIDAFDAVGQIHFPSHRGGDADLLGSSAGRGSFRRPSSPSQTLSTWVSPAVAASPPTRAMPTSVPPRQLSSLSSAFGQVSLSSSAPGLGFPAPTSSSASSFTGVASPLASAAGMLDQASPTLRPVSGRRHVRALSGRSIDHTLAEAAAAIEEAEMRSRYPQLDTYGEYFIDRDPDAFAAILHWYRTGKIHEPNNVATSAFQEELEFYGLDIHEMEAAYQGPFVDSRQVAERNMRRRVTEIAEREFIPLIDSAASQGMFSLTLEIASRSFIWSHGERSSGKVKGTYTRVVRDANDIVFLSQVPDVMRVLRNYLREKRNIKVFAYKILNVRLADNTSTDTAYFELEFS